MLLLSTLASAGPARAEPQPTGTILLVVDDRAVALATRVSAELESLGFQVESRTKKPDESELASEARSSGAFAAIAIGPTSQGNVEITVLDRVTGKTLRRELLGRSLSDPTTRELVALRASELLRASLMEIEAPHPTRGEVAPTPAVKRIATAPETIRRPERRLRVGAASGVMVVPGLSAAALLEATFGVKLAKRLELGFALGSQLGVAQHKFDEGRVETTARWLGIGLVFLPLPPSDSGRFALGTSAQLSALAVSASGFATDTGYRGQSRFAWTPGASVGLDLRVRVHGQLWWVTRPSIGVALRELSLETDTHRLRLWGRPWLEAATGLEVEL